MNLYKLGHKSGIWGWGVGILSVEDEDKLWAGSVEESSTWFVTLWLPTWSKDSRQQWTQRIIGNETVMILQLR